MQNALNTKKMQKISPQCIQVKEKKKKKSNLPCPINSPHVSDMKDSQPSPPTSHPLRKSSNIYIFNSIKNVKKRVHWATWLI